MGEDAGYGKHPTIYENLSDDKLYQMYMIQTWEKLDESQRQQLLQETVNRSAMAHGEIGSCKVFFFHDLGKGVDGKQSGNTIQLDYEKYVNDRNVEIYNGREIYHHVADANMQALTTVLHEDEHAFQNQVIDGKITGVSEELVREYRANNFSVSPVKDGETQALGSQYLNGELSYYLYYLQATERDAFRNSEAKTSKIMDYLEGKYGKDPSFDAYRTELRANGFDAILKEAQEFFQNNNIEKDINQTLMNHYYQTEVPVNKMSETAVKQEMIKSFQKQYLQNSSGQTHKVEGVEKMGDKVDFASLRVSEEEYDNALRSSVNAYYEHAMQDPSMSKEEAVAETGQMAGNYLNALDDFHENSINEAESNDVLGAFDEGNETGVNSGGEGLGGSNDGGIGGSNDGGPGEGSDGGSDGGVVGGVE